MAYYCTDPECLNKCKPLPSFDGLRGALISIVISDCCSAYVMDEDGNIIGPDDLPQTQAWLADGARAQGA
jgi:hypothetical protein